MKQSTNEWLKAADEDLLTIERLLSGEELTNIIAFHAQQAIEKTMKAVIEEFEIPFIRTHNLETLYLKVSKKIDVKIEEQLIAELDRLYLDARYPGDFGLMPSGKPTVEDAKKYFKEATNYRRNIGIQLFI